MCIKVNEKRDIVAKIRQFHYIYFWKLNAFLLQEPLTKISTAPSQSTVLFFTWMIRAQVEKLPGV